MRVRASWLLRLSGQLLVFAALWMILTGGELPVAALPAGILALTAAIALAANPSGATPLHLRGALRFVPFFLGRSIAGGFDVALRAYAPGRPLAPELTTFRTRLPAGSSSTVFFVDLINLVPGTLCAEVDGQQLTLHVVDRRGRFVADLRHLEAHVAALFGEPLDREEPPR
jgi:multicomponent Na+:H+ antiporter subunit E